MANKPQHGWPLTPSFERYLKLNENDVLLESMKGNRRLQKVRGPSPEKGTDTVGFGHKMTQEEHDSGFINGVRVSSYTREDINRLFQRDQSRIWERLNKKVQSEHKTSLKSLSIRQREMLFDFEYNVSNGIKAFPKFATAVVKGDYATALMESKRHYTDADTGEKAELTKRNQQFAAQFYNEAARKGDYTSEEAQASSIDTIDLIRKGEGEEALTAAARAMPSNTAEEASLQRNAVAQEAKVEAAAAPQQQEQAPQAPQALASNMPAPDIDLGGMLSKEYTAPSGEKGMLSPLGGGATGQLSSTNEQHTSVGSTA